MVRHQLTSPRLKESSNFLTSACTVKQVPVHCPTLQSLGNTVETQIVN